MCNRDKTMIKFEEKNYVLEGGWKKNDPLTMRFTYN